MLAAGLGRVVLQRARVRPRDPGILQGDGHAARGDLLHHEAAEQQRVRARQSGHTEVAEGVRTGLHRPLSVALADRRTAEACGELEGRDGSPGGGASAQHWREQLWSETSPRDGRRGGEAARSQPGRT